MKVIGRHFYRQRDGRSRGNSMRRVPKPPSLHRHSCLLALVGFAAVVSHGIAASATPAITTLANFNNANGRAPLAGLIADAAGNLYGTTYYGGPNNVNGTNDFGTVFEISAGTHALSTLVAFNSLNGANPNATLIADAAGNLYGTTGYGGQFGDGTIFELAAGTHAFSTLATFNNINGRFPQTGLIADAAGNLYGTAFIGGGNTNYGTVFKLASGTHVISTLATFNSSNGANPNGGLIADAAGNFYGTTEYGGANDNGTVFELTNTGFVTSVPEPAAVPLIGLAGLGLLARRRS
ncbi:MAG: hypothetical protein JWL69_831 [Phycisphaerales bacterium]|nr:hypothetical protein [Phycisphaerales bacterium]